jgi:hypothetical protein
MMRATHIDRPTKRPALGSCFLHGTGWLAAGVRFLSGRTKE